ncbi:MAG: Chromosomal replication initiator protein DnaA [Oceanicaulis sp. HLUCCA04]|nr:MAG: Chromosomal replication initiator protein DnaA [Oceanicaulis sp. HLUCCA04]
MATPQLALDLALEPDYRPESFAVSEANASALALVNRWPRWRMGHLVLTGPAGAGKTHLAHMWSQRTNARPVDRADISAALKTIQRGASVVIEDCDRGVDETGLFHLLNRAAGDSGISVLLTARIPARGWQIALPDLASRLSAAEAAALKEPDDALLRQVLEKLFRDRRTPLGAGVLDYLLARMERSVNFARILVARLDNAALAGKSAVTRPLARDVLAGLSAEQNPDEESGPKS